MYVTRSELSGRLRGLGLSAGDVAMVHCRMSALGNVIGGAETVVRALLDVVGTTGTIMSYTGWQDEPPELHTLDEATRKLYIEEHPVYDPATSLSRRDHGRIPEALRMWPDALHSGHPEAGVAAIGAKAGVLTSSHPPDDAYGENTPYSRLVEMSGKVLALGSPLETITLIHHAEAVARVPGKRRISYDMPVLDGGDPAETPTRRWRTFSDINTSEGAFPYEEITGETDYIEYIVERALEGGVGRSGRVGEATAHLFHARELRDFAVAWIHENFGRQNRK